MGSAYYRGTLGNDKPRVGLLNIGTEDSKGNPLTREAAQLLKDAPIHFIGSVEGVDVFSGRCEVVVCDGFTGNVLLKVSEGCAEYVLRTTAGFMKEVGLDPEGTKVVLHKLMQRVDYSEYGGAQLLGVDGVVTICHGRSGPEAICNAVRFAIRAVGAKVNQHIVTVARAAETSPQ
jgi:glycerol-3-phosphate acyltransferase PlsX